jgi:hypothetical protein
MEKSERINPAQTGISFGRQLFALGIRRLAPSRRLANGEQHERSGANSV